MKFICTQQNLSQGLALAEKIVTKNFTLPILQDILVSCEKGKAIITLSATDLEVGIEVFIPGKIEEEGGVAVPAKLFAGFVKNLPQKNIIISEKNKTIDVECENYKSQLKGESPKDYPLIPQTPAGNEFNVKNYDFCRGVSSVFYAVSTLDIKPELSGVYVQFQERTICFAATDSFRLSEKNISHSQKNVISQNIILPRKTCDLLTRVFQDQEDSLFIQMNNGQIVFQSIPKETFSPRIRLVSRVIEGDYPRYEQIIPQQFSISMEVEKEQLTHHIKTATLFSSRVNEVIWGINVKKQQLEISSNNQDYGAHHSTITCKIQGKDERIAFNAQYVLDGLGGISGEYVRIQANESTSPVLLSSFEDDGFRYIVMPIKTS